MTTKGQPPFGGRSDALSALPSAIQTTTAAVPKHAGRQASTSVGDNSHLQNLTLLSRIASTGG